MAVLIVTTESSGLDKYSQELAKRLRVRTIETGRYLSLRETYGLLRRIRGEKEVIHFPNQHCGRYALWGKRPFVITVHDLARLCFPFEKETLWERLLLKLDVIGIKRAERIIAVSQSTKRDLVKYLKIPEERIAIIYNGVDRSLFKPSSWRPLSDRYILYVGSERPRKNLGALLKAFSTLKKDFELKLVKVGPWGRTHKYREETLRQIRELGLDRDVIFIDHLSEDHLPHYYAAAFLFVYPSLYEGFGLPPLEAMACGCPVVTSNTSSLPEVVGDAALTVDPGDVAGLARAMATVLSNEELRKALIAKGFAQAGKFPWEETATRTLEIYSQVGASMRESRQERRERRKTKKKEKMPQHGKGMARVYKDAVLKRAAAKTGSVRSARRGRGK